MKALAIAATDLRRLTRWRANVFFLFVLPMLIILLLGAAFGADKARLGIVGGGSGPLAQQFVTAIDARPSTELQRYEDTASLQRGVSRGEVDAGIALPDDYDARLSRGERVTIRYVARPDSVAQQLRTTIASVAAEQGRVLAVAQLLMRAEHASFAPALERARAADAAIPKVAVAVRDPGGGPHLAPSSRFEDGASSQLLLFIFLTSLNGAVWLIETRRLGVARRMLSTPTPARTVVGGLLLGRLAVALLQALIIIVGCVVFFGVSWGDPLATGLTVVAFALVGTGAALLLGALFSSEQQAGPVALLLGLGLAALGGSMAPLEIFPDTARAIAHVTPHAWANDAFSEILNHDGHVGAVLGDVAVLLAFAAVLLGLATWRLRRAITGTRAAPR
jgi:ABC-2 type transport system permease protein